MAGYKSQSLFWWKIMSEFVKFQEEIKSERGFHYQRVQFKICLKREASPQCPLKSKKNKNTEELIGFEPFC